MLVWLDRFGNVQKELDGIGFIAKSLEPLVGFGKSNFIFHDFDMLSKHSFFEFRVLT